MNPRRAPIAQQENIYESTEKLVKPQLQIHQSNVRILPGTAQVLATPQQQQPPVNRLVHNVQVQHAPYRSQSVMDKMVGGSVYGYVGHRSSSASHTPVAFREQETLSRQEILARLQEFCEKSKRASMQKLSSQNNLSVAPKKEISPVSYASVHSAGQRLPTRVAPQVPPRNQSLQSAIIHGAFGDQQTLYCKT